MLSPLCRTIVGTASNLLNGTLGPGMLVLPLAFSRVGLVAGGLLLLVIWLFSYTSLLLLLKCCAAHRCSSFVVLARAHGPRMSAAVDVSVCLYFYGTCISYLILAGGTFGMMLRDGGGAVDGAVSEAKVEIVQLNKYFVPGESKQITSVDANE